MDAKAIIAKRVAKELKDGDVVNLGIGLPTMVVNYIPDAFHITLQSENGMLGLGPTPESQYQIPELTNAGGAVVSCLPGGSFFDSCMSFGIIRGGHVDATVLGALQVDAEGNLANWKVPGKLVPGMGGAMDLVVGANKVIVAMLHTQKGVPKIVEKCTLPLTAKHQVNLIITEMAVLKVTESGLVLNEIAKEVTVEAVRAATKANFTVADNLKTFG